MNKIENINLLPDTVPEPVSSIVRKKGSCKIKS